MWEYKPKFIFRLGWYISNMAFIYATLRGFIHIGAFYVVWIFSCFIIPVSFYMYFFYDNKLPILALVLYYGYRMVVPRKPWPWIHNLAISNQENNNYFRKQELIFEEKIEPDSSNLICFHPHGILTAGWIVNGNTRSEFYDARVVFMVVETLFYIPIISDIVIFNNTWPATKYEMVTRMEKKQNLALLPGGFEEATLYRNGRHRVFIKQRKGFVKYALQNGYKLVPTYTFGEERTYWAFSWLSKKLKFLNKYKIPTVFFIGKYLLAPNDNVSLITVVGSPLQLPRIEEPTDADVDEWHGKYV